MAVRFGKVYMDYMYLPGTAYTASRYAKDGFFTVTLPALKDRLMLNKCTKNKQRETASNIFASYKAHFGPSVLHC